MKILDYYSLVLKKIKEIKYSHLVVIWFVALLLGLFVLVNETYRVASEVNQNAFSYTIKVRQAIEYIDLILERAEVNMNVLADTVSNTYNINNAHSGTYNFAYIRRLDGLVKAVLQNSPNTNGAWFQLNADLPYASRAYNWYEFRDDEFINLKAQLEEDALLADRQLTPEDDKYYFDAVKNRDTTWSDIYTDVDSKVKMITLSRPVYGDNRLIGVAGVDISVKNLQQALQEMQMLMYDSEFFILNRQDDIILSQTTSKLTDNSKEASAKQPFLELFDSEDGDAGMVEYFQGLTKKTAIKLALSNKYSLVITFDNMNVFLRFDRFFYAIYFILIILSGLALIGSSNRDKIVEIDKDFGKENSTIRNLLDYSPNMVLIKDVKGVYTDCNSKILSILGVEKNDFIGKTDYDFFNKDDVEENQQNEKIVVLTKKAMMVESSYFNKEGSEFVVRKQIIPLVNQAQQVFGILIVGVDITNQV